MKKGLTIIELLIGVSIFLAIVTVVAKFQKDTFFFNNLVSNSLFGQQEARQIFRSTSMEIRSISPSSTGAYPIAEASNFTFTFYSDIDDDGLKERIRYFLDGTTLKKGVLKPSGSPLAYSSANEVLTEILQNIVNGSTPVFQYYDTHYAGDTSPLSVPVNIPLIRLVKITVLIDRDSLRPPPATTITTQISIRNLKDNL